MGDLPIGTTPRSPIPTSECQCTDPRCESLTLGRTPKGFAHHCFMAEIVQSFLVFPSYLEGKLKLDGEEERILPIKTVLGSRRGFSPRGWCISTRERAIFSYPIGTSEPTLMLLPLPVGCSSREQIFCPGEALASEVVIENGPSCCSLTNCLVFGMFHPGFCIDLSLCSSSWPHMELWDTKGFNGERKSPGTVLEVINQR